MSILHYFVHEKAKISDKFHQLYVSVSHLDWDVIYLTELLSVLNYYKFSFGVIQLQKVDVYPSPDVSNTIVYHWDTFLLQNPWSSAWLERHVELLIIHIHLKVNSMWLAQVPQGIKVQGEEKGTEDWPLGNPKVKVISSEVIPSVSTSPTVTHCILFWK